MEILSCSAQAEPEETHDASVPPLLRWRAACKACSPTGREARTSICVFAVCVCVPCRNSFCIAAAAGKSDEADVRRARIE